ncbi:MAG: DUF1552 domain-containing protein [Gammaproteobacteria bacterium]|jgi:hypothetical protein|nr:DUF1552 domain-containing protein [Gammaproteobacteria bacterium]MBT6043047.1 DUF1552 domain-containing protein [Gammaproteobacteria bacterium]
MATFLTKKHLSRRTLLRSGAVGLGLPFLDAMVPAGTALAQVEAMPKKRAGFFYLPHGTIMNNTPFGKEVDAWTSSGSGDNFQLGHILEPMDPLKQYLTTFENIENTAAGGSVHTLNPATWLSCVRPGTGSTPELATTLDQVIAQQLGQETALPSLELATETTIQVAAGNGGFYAVTTSFSAPNKPLPMEFNPRKVFIQLMGPYDTEAEREAILRKNSSILDMIADRTQALRKDLGPGDRALLSDYLDTVREIERRVQLAGERDMTGVDVPAAPVGQFEDFDEQIKMMFDLIALAYQADLTRIATLVMAAEGTDRTYEQVDVAGGFHPTSHHTNDPARIADLTRIQRYHMDHFARFVQKLADTPDGDGSILDHSMFLYGSNMGNSNQHDNYPLPEILVGGASGAMQGGQNIILPERTPLANVHLTILDRLGIPQESFGNSTGIISEV